MHDAERHDDDNDEIASEERAIYAIMLVAAAPIVIALLAEGRSIEGGNVIMLILVALAVLGLGAGVRALRRGKLPRARVIRRR